jgi:hypothetical protein
MEDWRLVDDRELVEQIAVLTVEAKLVAEQVTE